MEESLQRPVGPGPAKYRLPGTIGPIVRDPRLRRSPAFTFGRRLKLQDASCSPGPKYLIPPNFTQRGITTTQGFSLYSRAAELPPPLVPGPGRNMIKSEFIVKANHWNS